MHTITLTKPYNIVLNSTNLLQLDHFIGLFFVKTPNNVDDAHKKVLAALKAIV